MLLPLIGYHTAGPVHNFAYLAGYILNSSTYLDKGLVTTMVPLGTSLALVPKFNGSNIQMD